MVLTRRVPLGMKVLSGGDDTMQTTNLLDASWLEDTRTWTVEIDGERWGRTWEFAGEALEAAAENVLDLHLDEDYPEGETVIVATACDGEQRRMVVDLASRKYAEVATRGFGSSSAPVGVLS